MAATAPIPTPYGRSLPSNQTTTMGAFTDPSTPMPFGARAIQQSLARNAVGAYNGNLAAAQAMTPGGLNPQQSASFYESPGGPQTDLAGFPINPGASGFAGMEDQGHAYGAPVTQTAAGGVMAPDMTDPNAWANVLRSQMPVVHGHGTAPTSPRLMVSSRMGGNGNVGGPGYAR